MNNLNSFTNYLNTIKQTLHNNSINYLELNNKIKSLETIIPKSIADTDLTSKINEIIATMDFKVIIEEAIAKIDFKSMIDKYVEDKLSSVITDQSEVNIETSINELQMPIETLSIELLDGSEGVGGSEGVSTGTDEEDMVLNIKEEKKNKPKRRVKK